MFVICWQNTGYLDYLSMNQSYQTKTLHYNLSCKWLFWWIVLSFLLKNVISYVGVLNTRVPLSLWLKVFEYLQIWLLKSKKPQMSSCSVFRLKTKSQSPTSSSRFHPSLVEQIGNVPTINTGIKGTPLEYSNLRCKHFLFS